MVVWESAWVGVNKTEWIKMQGETVKFITVGCIIQKNI
jgi:hypothetical protein